MSEYRYHLRGECDIAVSGLLRADLELATNTTGAELLVVDCTDLTFIDASGIAALVAANHDLRARGRRMLIANLLGREPRRVFDVLGLTDVRHHERKAIGAELGVPLTRHADRHRCTRCAQHRRRWHPATGNRANRL
jgi:anti-anti-sigma factor